MTTLYIAPFADPDDPDAWDRADAQWRVRAAEWQALVREAAEWNNK